MKIDWQKLREEQFPILKERTYLMAAGSSPMSQNAHDRGIGYFKDMSEENGVPYQSLINLYLRDCVATHRKVDISWHSKP